MEILYLLIPMSAVLVLAVLGIFAWALGSGQFDDLEQQGARILEGEARPFDGDQRSPEHETEQSIHRP